MKSTEVPTSNKYTTLFTLLRHFKGGIDNIPSFHCIHITTPLLLSSAPLSGCQFVALPNVAIAN